MIWSGQVDRYTVAPRGIYIPQRIHHSSERRTCRAHIGSLELGWASHEELVSKSMGFYSRLSKNERIYHILGKLANEQVVAWADVPKVNLAVHDHRC